MPAPPDPPPLPSAGGNADPAPAPSSDEEDDRVFLVPRRYGPRPPPRNPNLSPRAPDRAVPWCLLPFS